MRYALALILVCSMAAFAQQAPRVTDSDNRLAQAPAPDLPKPSAAIQEVRKADEKWLAGYGEFLTQREKVNALKQRTGIADAEAKVLSLRKAHPQVAEAEAKMVEMSTALTAFNALITVSFKYSHAPSSIGGRITKSFVRCCNTTPPAPIIRTTAISIVASSASFRERAPSSAVDKSSHTA